MFLCFGGIFVGSSGSSFGEDFRRIEFRYCSGFGVGIVGDFCFVFWLEKRFRVSEVFRGLEFGYGRFRVVVKIYGRLFF